MKGFKWFCGIIVGGMSCLTAMAIPEPGSRYQLIPDRNLFRLKEPPAVQQTNVEPPAALPKLYLTGITTILRNKLAFFSVQFPAKAGQPAREESLTLSEGQRDEGIELLAVDVNARAVKVNNSGTEMSLNFENNGLKAAGAATNGTPNQPHTLVPPGPLPGMQTPGIRRSLRLPGPSGVQPPPVPTTEVSPPRSNAAFSGPAAAAQRQAQSISTQVTPEEEQLLKELQQKLAPQ